MSTTTTPSSPAPGARPRNPPPSLLDLPMEIRLIIYHHMFDGSHIRLRAWDSSHHLLVDPTLERKRQTGSNLMFTSKALLSEVKPLLLRAVSFGLLHGSGIWEEEGVVEGFSPRELSMVSSLVLTVYSILELNSWNAGLVEHVDGLSRLTIDFKHRSEMHVGKRFERWMKSKNSLDLSPVRKEWAAWDSELCSNISERMQPGI